MNRWALISAGTVVTVVESDAQPGSDWVDVTGQRVGPGWKQNGQGWTIPGLQWPAFEWARRLTAQERIGVRTLAVTDPVAQDFIHLLDWAISSATPIYADDPDLQAGLAYLGANPAGNPILAAGRAAQLLAP